MKLYGVTDSMPFGRYRGELVGTVIEDDPAYIEWMIENTEFRLDDQAIKYLRECQA